MGKMIKWESNLPFYLERHMKTMQLALSRSKPDIELIRQMISENFIKSEDIVGNDENPGALELLVKRFVLRGASNQEELRWNDEWIVQQMPSSLISTSLDEGLPISMRELDFIEELVLNYQVDVDRPMKGIQYSPLDIAVMLRDPNLCERLFASPGLDKSELANRTLTFNGQTYSWFKWMNYGKGTQSILIDALNDENKEDLILNNTQVSEIESWESLKVLIKTGSIDFGWKEAGGEIIASNLKNIPVINESVMYSWVDCDSSLTPRQNLEMLVLGALSYSHHPSKYGIGQTEKVRNQYLLNKSNMLFEKLKFLGLDFNDIEVPSPYGSGNVSLPIYVSLKFGAAHNLFQHIIKAHPELYRWKSSEENDLGLFERGLWAMSSANAENELGKGLFIRLAATSSSVGLRPKQLFSKTLVAEHVHNLKVLNECMKKKAFSKWASLGLAYLQMQSVYKYPLGAQKLVDYTKEFFSIPEMNKVKFEHIFNGGMDISVGAGLKEQIKHLSMDDQKYLATILHFHNPTNWVEGFKWHLDYIPKNEDYYIQNKEEGFLKHVLNSDWAESKFKTIFNDKQKTDDFMLQVRLDKKLITASPSKVPSLTLGRF